MKRVAENDPHLTTLDLRGFDLGADGAADLAMALDTNQVIVELILWVNHVGDQGAVALAPAIAAHPKLVKVDFFNNDIGDMGAIALADVIKRSKSVSEFNLWTNNIGDEGAFAIAAALENNSTITSLQLENNKISDDGASALGGAIAMSEVLTAFSLKDNRNITDNTTISSINQWIFRNQASKRQSEEAEASQALARELSFPIHSDSQKADLTLLAACIHDGPAALPSTASIVLDLVSDTHTSDRVDITPALCGDRVDEFGLVQHSSVPMQTGWVGNRKG